MILRGSVLHEWMISNGSLWHNCPCIPIVKSDDHETLLGERVVAHLRHLVNV